MWSRLKGIIYFLKYSTHLTHAISKQKKCFHLFNLDEWHCAIIQFHLELINSSYWESVIKRCFSHSTTTQASIYPSFVFWLNTRLCDDRFLSFENHVSKRFTSLYFLKWILLVFIKLVLKQVFISQAFRKRNNTSKRSLHGCLYFILLK